MESKTHIGIPGTDARKFFKKSTTYYTGTGLGVITILEKLTTFLGELPDGYEGMVHEICYLFRNTQKYTCVNTLLIVHSKGSLQLG